MKAYKVKFEVFWDANDIREVTVKANTERKAITLATDKIKKETGWDMPKLVFVQEVSKE